jgi:preprotein translocase subunit SecG
VFGFFIVLHVIICISLVIAVLMQSAKGEGLAGMFGGGGALSGAVFGGRGAASFLSKATTYLAVAFMVSCIWLTLISKGRTMAGGAAPESAVQKAAQEQAQQQLPPQTPAQSQGQGQQQDPFAEPGATGGEGQVPAGAGEGSGEGLFEDEQPSSGQGGE